MMRALINYIRSCFCQHDWELIFNAKINYIDTGDTEHCKTYRCKKCGYSMKYRLN